MNFPNVLFVQMPWASVRRPSLALGILTRLCSEMDIRSSVCYPNIHMAGLIGLELSDHLSRDRFSYGFSEHIFATDIFGIDALDSDGYLESFCEVARGNPTCPADKPQQLHWLRDDIVPRFLDAVAARVIAARPDILALSATFNQVMAGLALAKRVKASLPGIRVIAGGACYDGPMGVEYHHAVPEIIDNVFIGEGEAPLREFLSRCIDGRSLAGIPGITWRENDEIRLLKGEPLHDLNTSPTPDYDDYFNEISRAKDGGSNDFAVAPLPFESSRGCWWGAKSQCTFCGTNPESIGYRAKHPDRVVKELVTLSARYRVTKFAASDLVMTPRADLLESLADLDLDLELFYEVRTHLSKEQVGLLARAKVREVQAGVESFSTPALGLMRKGATALKHIQFLRWAQEARVRVVYNLLDGFPDEDPSWYEEMGALISRLTHLEPPRYDPVRIELHRFSPLFEKRAQRSSPIARADYAFNFPLGMIDESRFAYFYESDNQHEALAHRPQIEAAVQAWRENWNKTPAPAFNYSIGAGFLKIVDKRNGTEQISFAADLHHDILLLCDQIRSINALARDLMPRRRAEIAAGKLDTAVEELVSAGILLREGDNLLMLPTCETFRLTRDLRAYVLGEAVPAAVPELRCVGT